MTLESSGVNAKLMHERGESTFSLLQLQQALKRHALAIHVNNIFCQSLNNDWSHSVHKQHSCIFISQQIPQRWNKSNESCVA